MKDSNIIKYSSDLKALSESKLEELGIIFNPNLPLAFTNLNTELRNSKEISKRVIVLWEVVNNANRNQYEEKVASVEFLKDVNLWETASVNEKTFLLSKERPKQEIINYTWKTEALKVLYWALNEIENLGKPFEDLNLVGISEKVGQKYNFNIDEFITKSKIRNKLDILKETDFIYRLHWATKKHRRDKTNIPKNYIYSVVYERHYTLNWLTDININWDDISCDT